MIPKQRLSASVDADLIKAAEAAATRGEVSNVSAWVNEALRLKLDHDRRLRNLAELVEEYEGRHGEITADEMAEAYRRARSRAVTVRGSRPRVGTKRRRTAP